MGLRTFTPPRKMMWPDYITHLSDAVTPHKLYIVGGAVRDALRGAPIHDIDLATPASGLTIAKQIANKLDGAYYPVDPERHTGRAIVEISGNTLIIDVARFRGDDLKSDLNGRDFTINAIASPLDNPDQIIDPLQGYEDLFERKRLRMCSDKSIANDPVRAIRALRHSLQLTLRIEQNTLKSIRAALPALFGDDHDLRQPERTRDELFKLFTVANPSVALRLMKATGLAGILPVTPIGSTKWNSAIREVEALHQVVNIISNKRNDNSAANMKLGVAVMVLDRFRHELQDWLEQSFGDGRSIQVLLVLNCLQAYSDNDDVSIWDATFRLSREETSMLQGLQHAREFNLTGLQYPLPDRNIYKYFRASGSAGIGGVIITLAHYLASSGVNLQGDDWGRILEEVAAPVLDAYFNRYHTVVAPNLMVDGHDLMRTFNIEPGPLIGQIITHLQEEQAAGTITSKKEAFRFAERLLAASKQDPDQGPTSRTNGS